MNTKSNTITVELDPLHAAWLEQAAAANGFTIERQAAACLASAMRRDDALRAGPIQFIEAHVKEIQSGIHRLLYPEGRSDTR